LTVIYQSVAYYAINIPEADLFSLIQFKNETKSRELLDNSAKRSPINNLNFTHFIHIKMATNFQLFVYGSLRKDFNHPAHQFISRYFNFIGAAKVQGVLYDLGEYPAAIPTTENRFIKGELYAIKLADEFNYAMAQLDDYEGLIVEEGGRPLYIRELVNVYLNDSSVQAWMYWYNNSVSGFPIIENGDVLEYMRSKS
jgi:gamma-glutamylcyclotransferase (GGCT)/AIG2-like uncharacterized protein YtfP